jgi:hypothetical protein
MSRSDKGTGTLRPNSAESQRRGVGRGRTCYGGANMDDSLRVPTNHSAADFHCKHVLRCDAEDDDPQKAAWVDAYLAKRRIAPCA